MPRTLLAPIEVAVNRCNAQTIDDAQSRVRDYDRHSPGNGPSQLVQRYGAILDVLSMLNEEREILGSICTQRVADGRRCSRRSPPPRRGR